MKIFVTGANGFIGKAVVQELFKHNHQVLGLARNDTTKEAFLKIGVEPLPGDLTNLESLKTGAQSSDGVIHLAFRHDILATDYVGAAEADNAAVRVMCEALVGTGKPLVIASGTLGLAGQDPGTEDSSPDRTPPFGQREVSADLVREFSKKGVRGSVIRLTPTVHGAGDKAFIPMIMDTARKNGVVTYVGDGSARWPAGHRDDAAVLFRLAVEKGTAGAVYHAVDEEGIAWKDIAAVISKHLNIPSEGKSMEEAVKTVGFLAHVQALDNPTSSEKTRAELGWTPTQPGLLADMEANYFA